MHREGPFKGMEIDENKVLMACTGSSSEYIERDGIDYFDLNNDQQEEISSWFGSLKIALLRGEAETCEQLMKEELGQRLTPPTPEGWGEGWFLHSETLYSGTEQGNENLKEVHEVIKECGCREGDLQHPYVGCESEIHIIWD